MTHTIRALLFCGLAACCQAGLRADLDGDGRVDFADLAIVAEEWLMSDELGPELVINGTFTGGLDPWFVGMEGLYYRTDDVAARVAVSPKYWNREGLMYQPIALKAGRTYRLSVTVDIIIDGVADYHLGVNNVTTGRYELFRLSDGLNVFTFTASSDYEFLALGFRNGVYDPLYLDADAAVFDNVSLREALEWINVYRGQDGDIDYESPVGVMGLDDTQISLTGQDLPAGTAWHYVRRHVKGCCGKESPDSPVCIVRIGPDGELLGEKPNPPDDMSAEAVAGGKIRLRWRYHTAGQETPPAGFVIYRDALDVPIAAVPAGSGLRGSYAWVSGALTHGQVYKWCVRAYSAAGDLSDNSAFVGAVADSQGPTAVTNLAAEWEEI